MTRISTLLCLLLIHQAAPGAPEAPTRYDLKLSAMPDFCQGDNRVGPVKFPAAVACGPVSVSNALMWLDRNGHSKILPKDGDAVRDQLKLIHELCSPNYMNTHDGNGTSPRQIVTGLEKFFSARGYQPKIEQMSWRSSAKRIGRAPTVDWMIKSCQGGSNIVLNIGWYQSLPGEKAYFRKAGHWVTVAGFEQRGPDTTLFIHDPAVRNGLDKKTMTCTLRALPTGNMLRLQSGGTNSADGFFELAGVVVKRGADLAIIDGAVAFDPTPSDD